MSFLNRYTFVNPIYLPGVLSNETASGLEAVTPKAEPEAIILPG